MRILDHYEDNLQAELDAEPQGWVIVVGSMPIDKHLQPSMPHKAMVFYSKESAESYGVEGKVITIQQAIQKSLTRIAELRRMCHENL
jgi:hypothetical protein